MLDENELGTIAGATAPIFAYLDQHNAQVRQSRRQAHQQPNRLAGAVAYQAGHGGFGGEINGAQAAALTAGYYLTLAPLAVLDALGGR